MSNVIRLRGELRALLEHTKKVLDGLTVETKSKQKRDFATSDFVIDELRRLSTALEKIIPLLERLPESKS